MGSGKTEEQSVITFSQTHDAVSAWESTNPTITTACYKLDAGIPGPQMMNPNKLFL